MLEYLDELPDIKRGNIKTSYVAQDVEDFINSDKDVALVTYEGKSTQTVNQTLRNYIAANDIYEIAVVIRGGEVYLTKF